MTPRALFRHGRAATRESDGVVGAEAEDFPVVDQPEIRKSVARNAGAGLRRQNQPRGDKQNLVAHVVVEAVIGRLNAVARRGYGHHVVAPFFPIASYAKQGQSHGIAHRAGRRGERSHKRR